MFFSEKAHREKGRGQCWRMSFVGKTSFIIDESQANTTMPYADLLVLVPASCPVTAQILSCEFLFLQKIQVLLRIHSSVKDNRDHVGKCSGSSMSWCFSFPRFYTSYFSVHEFKKNIFSVLLPKHLRCCCCFPISVSSSSAWSYSFHTTTGIN